MMDPAWIKVLSKSGFKENLDDKAVGKMEDTIGLKLGLTDSIYSLFLYLLLQWLPCLCCCFCCYCYYRYRQILLFLYTVSSTAMAALSVLFLKYYSSNALLFARLQCLLFSSLPTRTVTPFADVSRIGPQGSISCKDNSSV